MNSFSRWMLNLKCKGVVLKFYGKGWKERGSVGSRVAMVNNGVLYAEQDDGKFADIDCSAWAKCLLLCEVLCTFPWHNSEAA